MGRAALDEEDLSEEAIFETSFELQERANHTAMRKKTSQAREHQSKGLEERENLASSGSKNTRRGRSAASRGEVRSWKHKQVLGHMGP